MCQELEVRQLPELTEQQWLSIVECPCFRTRSRRAGEDAAAVAAAPVRLPPQMVRTPHAADSDGGGADGCALARTCAWPSLADWSTLLLSWEQRAFRRSSWTTREFDRKQMLWVYREGA